jgi:hypothetical protein
VAYLVLVVAVAYGFWVNHKQDLSRCEARNDSIRTSVLLSADALVAAAHDADQGQIDDYLSDLNRRLEAVEVDCT